MTQTILSQGIAGHEGRNAAAARKHTELAQSRPQSTPKASATVPVPPTPGPSHHPSRGPRNARSRAQKSRRPAMSGSSRSDTVVIDRGCCLADEEAGTRSRAAAQKPRRPKTKPSQVGGQRGAPSNKFAVQMPIPTPSTRHTPSNPLHSTHAARALQRAKVAPSTNQDKVASSK